MDSIDSYIKNKDAKTKNRKLNSKWEIENNNFNNHSKSNNNNNNKGRKGGKNKLKNQT